MGAVRACDSPAVPNCRRVRDATFTVERAAQDVEYAAAVLADEEQADRFMTLLTL
eukprot:COSAG05_NODE_2228_length_3363_cov_1.655331_2_plen_55_part_00